MYICKCSHIGLGIRGGTTSICLLLITLLTVITVYVYELILSLRNFMGYNNVVTEIVYLGKQGSLSFSVGVLRAKSDHLHCETSFTC